MSDIVTSQIGQALWDRLPDDLGTNHPRSDWSQDLVDYAKETGLAEYARRLGEWIGSETPLRPEKEQVLAMWRLSFRGFGDDPFNMVHWRSGEPWGDALAAWLLDQTDFIASFADTDAVPEGNPYPEEEYLVHIGHRREHENLRAWANSTLTVLDSVDEQATALVAILAWPGDCGGSCGTTGAAKEYLGQVMRYAKARLATESVVDDPYAVGRWLRVTRSNPIGINHLNLDDLVQVVDGTGNYLSPRYVCVSGPGGTPNLASGALIANRGYWVFSPASARELLAPASPPPVTTPDGVTTGQDDPEPPIAQPVEASPEPVESAEVRDLRAQIRRMEAEKRTALAVIDGGFWAEAKTRSWCSEAESAIEKMNRLLPSGWELTDNRSDAPDAPDGYDEEEWNVTWDEVYTVRISRSATFTANSYDAAIEMASDMDCAVGSLSDLRYQDGSIEYDSCDNYDADRAE